ncbi:MAG: YqaJ viral recombinase family protein [Clostridium sp.]
MSLVLASTSNMAHDEWLEARRYGIGGSDVSGICGLNNYKSPLNIYLDKVGEHIGEHEQSEAAYWGNTLEEVVAREFTKRTGKKVRNRNVILQHKDYPWMLANLDRVVVGENAILECKTASAYLLKDWDGEEIPDAYILQVQHYLAVTGYEKAYIACLVGGQKFIYKEVEKDQEIIDYLINIEKDFWLNHVEKKVPPPVDGSKASSEVLNIMYPKATVEEVINLDTEIQGLLKHREELKTKESEIEESINKIDNRIKNLMGEHATAVAGEFKITWSNVTSKRVDSKKLKEKCPDIYKQYLKEISSRKFQIKKMKEAK